MTKPLNPEEQSIRLFYFSGTGNTQIITTHIAESLKAEKFNVEVNRIEDFRNGVSINKNDVIGIGFPIASFSTYPVVFEFLNNLPDVNRIPLFGYCTMAGASLYGIIDEINVRMRVKGFTLLGFSEFKMPINIFFVMSKEQNKTRIDNAFHQAEQFVDGLVNGNAVWRKRIPGSGYIFALTDGIFKLSQTAVHQKMFKIWIDSDKCTRCGRCVATCPIQNISINNKVKIGNQCQYCFRCVAVCPKKATHGILSPASLHYCAEGARFLST